MIGRFTYNINQPGLSMPEAGSLMYILKSAHLEVARTKLNDEHTLIGTSTSKAHDCGPQISLDISDKRISSKKPGVDDEWLALAGLAYNLGIYANNDLLRAKSNLAIVSLQALQLDPEPAKVQDPVVYHF